MVECNPQLDILFQSLSHPVRRDILKRVAKRSHSISMLAGCYSVSLAAIAKHVNLLAQAKLVTKERRGKERIVSVAPRAFEAAKEHLEAYEKIWQSRLDTLDSLLTK